MPKARRRCGASSRSSAYWPERGRGPDGPLIVPGTAIFLNRGTTTPLALRANVECNSVRHEQHVVIVTVEIETIPRVPATNRVEVDSRGHEQDGITRVIVRFGYAEEADLPATLGSLTPEQTGGEVDLEGATYFLSRIELRAGDNPAMAAWRKHLFIATSHVTADAAEHFNLPRDRVVMLGSHVEV
jgi:KUP system potassium uptake protein